MDYRENISNLLKSVQRQGIDKLIDFLNTSDFFNAPASNSYHGNFGGGLVTHSYNVYRIYVKLAETFKRDIPKESLIIGGLLHDICKVNFYKEVQKWKKNDSNKWESYNGYDIEDQEPMGHGSKSVIMLRKYIDLTDLEIYSILYHMGIPEGYSEKCSFNAAMEMFPDAICLHLADLMSSKLFEKTI